MVMWLDVELSSSNVYKALQDKPSKNQGSVSALLIKQHVSAWRPSSGLQNIGCRRLLIMRGNVVRC